jgi:hypothetical protein
MSHRLRLLVPIASVIAALMAGCGGSGAGHTGPLTHAQLIAKATPICNASIKKQSEAATQLRKTNASGEALLEALAKSAPGLASSQSQSVSQLRELTPPASLAHDWQSLLAGLQRLAEGTAKIGANAKKKDLPAVEQAVSAGNATRSQLLNLASHDGFGTCGRAN